MRKGLELARAYYEQYGRPMLEKEFPDVLDRIAAGLCGHGSECFGYDDAVSRDHDFEPGFCLWLTDEDERTFGFRLFRAYRRLPQEFEGIRLENKSLFGSDFKGVHTIRQFYSFYIGEHLPQTNEEWLQIPDFYLAEATNGEVFTDPLGEFTRTRQALLERPEDVRLKKLGSCVFYMAQLGQYNYARCLKHGEKAAAASALADFCRNAAQACFLLNHAYAPYYKWLFRAMRELPVMGQWEPVLAEMLAMPCDEKANVQKIEELCAALAQELRKQELVKMQGDYLEPYAYAIGDNICDSALRNSPVML